MVPGVDVVKRIRWEQKQYWRNPAAAAFSFAFPLLVLVVFTAINGNTSIQLTGGVVKFAQYYVPAIISFGLIQACYTNLAFTVTVRRETGVLKRTRGTPMSPRLYFAGMIGNVIIVSIILTALTTLLGLVAYGITFPSRYLAVVVTIAAAAFCFSALGIAASTVVPNEDAAPAIINFIVFPLLFISGTFGRVRNDSLLGRIAAVFPIRHLNEAMIGAFNPFGTGTGLAARHLAMLVLWGIIGIAVALRRFSWEPRIP
jgi:ABC-2 type transport system permease protein